MMMRLFMPAEPINYQKGPGSFERLVTILRAKGVRCRVRHDRLTKADKALGCTLPDDPRYLYVDESQYRSARSITAHVFGRIQ